MHAAPDARTRERRASRSWPTEPTPRLGLTADTGHLPHRVWSSVTTTAVATPWSGSCSTVATRSPTGSPEAAWRPSIRRVDTRLTRTVAVKVMHVGLGDDEEFARKFDREARAAARLSHPNVVSVFDQGQDSDGQALPAVHRDGVRRGPHPARRDQREAPLTPLRALDLIEPMLGRPGRAHDAGLVHRDVKPENVLISDRNQIKVADFGLAKAVSSQTSTATQGLLIGTVSYLPPELVLSGRADARSDVYSAGVVLFELLTGLKPHTGETPIQVAVRARAHRRTGKPSEFPTAAPIPPYLDALVARATARDAALRPHDARVMLAQVRRVHAALAEGLSDDPELTEDLSPLFSVRVIEPETETSYERADYEPTQLVPAAAVSGPRSVLPPLAPERAARAPRTASSPTVVDAPPPPVARTSAAPVVDRRAAERGRQQRRRRRGWIAFLVVLLLTGLAALTGWYVVAGRFTTAPPLVMLGKVQAEKVAGDAGLEVGFGEVYSETVAKGLIAATTPPAGSKVLKGGRIEAEVSLGPERYPMPAVVGLAQADAENALTSAHLTVGKVTTAYSDSVALGLVVSASEKTGQGLKPDSRVDLVVSKGVQPIKITDYTGKPADDAEKALQKAGFTVVEQTDHSDSVAKDSVISQSPDQGTGKKGDTITVVRSLGPVLVSVPYTKGMGMRAAERLLHDAGFTTKIRPVAINYIGVGFVVYTNPKARSQAPKGSLITIYVV